MHQPSSILISNTPALDPAYKNVFAWAVLIVAVVAVLAVVAAKVRRR